MPPQPCGPKEVYVTTSFTMGCGAFSLSSLYVTTRAIKTGHDRRVSKYAQYAKKKKDNLSKGYRRQNEEHTQGRRFHLCPFPLLSVAVQRVNREAAIPRLLSDPVAHTLLRRENDLRAKQNTEYKTSTHDTSNGHVSSQDGVSMLAACRQRTQ